MKITVNVTANDIKHGKPTEPCLCPVARALRRKGDKNGPVGVGFYYADFRKDGFFRQFELPSHVRQFIRNFDRNLPVKPFKFVVEVK